MEAIIMEMEDDQDKSWDEYVENNKKSISDYLDRYNVLELEICDKNEKIITRSFISKYQFKALVPKEILELDLVWDNEKVRGFMDIYDCTVESHNGHISDHLRISLYTGKPDKFDLPALPVR